MKVLYRIRNLPYMVIGSSVSRKACYSFLKEPYMAIELLVSRKHVTKFYWMAIYHQEMSDDKWWYHEILIAM